MDCWHVLSIEPTSDLYQIKLAYTEKLKKTKPDVDPEGFKRLHAAYKEASQLAPYINVEEQEDDDSEKTLEQIDGNEEAISYQYSTNWPAGNVERKSLLENQAGRRVSVDLLEGLEQHFDEAHVTDDGSLAYESYDVDIDFNKAWVDLQEFLSMALHDKKTANKIETWWYLESIEALQEFDFKSRFSIYLFGCLIESRERFRIKKKIIDYLDEHFMWSSKRDVLEDNFNYEEIEDLLFSKESLHYFSKERWISPKLHNKPIEDGNYHARIFATIVDLAFFSIAFLLIDAAIRHLFFNGRHFIDNKISFFLIMVGFFFLLIPIMEASPIQGTPGKVLMDIKVTGRQGKRLNIFHAYWRTLMFLISTAAFKITVWINMFLPGGDLLHDLTSASRVIKR